MTKKFCEKSIYWVLSYRNSPRKQMHKLYRYGFVEDHSEESWEWTLREANKIGKNGLEYWLKETEGPYGFHYWCNKYKSK
jgi:hypothetical protein